MAETCAGCVYYRGRHADDAALQRAEAAGHPFPPGHCRRFPEPVSKRPEDWCGEWRPEQAIAEPVLSGRITSLKRPAK